MKQLTEEAKQAIVKKALNGNHQGLKSLAESYNVGYSTLQKWLRFYRKGETTFSINKSAGQLTSTQRLNHLLATAKLDEVSMGAYCRQQGLYSHQLQQWKDEFMSDNKTNKNQPQLLELKALRAENKMLKRDLRRKDSALAETTALLVLKKKADLIWGEPEDV
jgi:transposase